MKRFGLVALVVLGLIGLASSFRMWQLSRLPDRKPASITIRVVDLSGKPRDHAQISFSEWGFRYFLPIPFTQWHSSRREWMQETDANGQAVVQWRDQFLEINEVSQNRVRLPWAYQTLFKRDREPTVKKNAEGFGGVVALYDDQSFNMIEYATSPELKWNDER